MSDFVLENKVVEQNAENILNTQLSTKGLMKIDNSLVKEQGLTKVIYKLTYNGEVQELLEGEGSTVFGENAGVSKEYTATRKQTAFKYTDDQAYKDKFSVINKYNGIADVMVNDINTRYFNELAEIGNVHKYSSFGYNAIVDGLSSLNLEVEQGYFIVIGNDLKATLRKDVDFKSANQGEIIHTGMIGNICGLPVIYSKLVKKGMAYIVKADSVTMFNKQLARVEQERNKNTKETSVYCDRYSIIALTDETHAIKLSELGDDLTVTLTAGTGKVTLTAQTPATGYKFYYKASDVAIADGECVTDRFNTTDWTVYSANADIACTAKKYVAVIKVKSADNTVVAFGKSDATPN